MHVKQMLFLGLTLTSFLYGASTSLSRLSQIPSLFKTATQSTKFLIPKSQQINPRQFNNFAYPQVMHNQGHHVPVRNMLQKQSFHNPLVHQRRGILSPATIHGTLENQNTTARSPHIASLNIKNVTEQVQNKNPYTERFFGITQEGELRDTRLPGNPLMSATTKDLGGFSKAIQESPEAVSKFIESDSVKQWHQQHYKTLNRFKDPKDFKKELKKIAHESTQQNPQTVQDHFNLAVYLKGHTQDDLTHFYDGLGIAYEKSGKTLNTHTITPCDVTTLSQQEKSAEFENAFFILKNTSDLSALRVPSIHAGYKGQPAKPLCIEESIRGLLQTMLYNPETKQLSLSALPKELTPSDQLQTFINHNANVNNEGYYKDSAKAWLDTVSNLPGVKYQNNSHQGNYELSSGEQNVISVLNNLLGTKAASLQELATTLSTPERTINITPAAHNQFKTSVSHNNYTASGLLTLNSGHGSFALDQAANKGLTLDQGAYLEDLSKAISPTHTLLTLIKDKNLFKFLEDAREEKKYASFKKVLDAKKWNLNLKNQYRTPLISGVADNPELLKIVLENAQKYNITFSQDSWDLALWNASKNVNALTTVLIESSKSNITFNNAWHRPLNNAIHSTEQFHELSTTIQKCKSSILPETYNAFWNKALTHAAYNPESLKIVLENAQKYNITFSEGSWNLALWNASKNLNALTTVLIESSKSNITFNNAWHRPLNNAIHSTEQFHELSTTIQKCKSSILPETYNAFWNEALTHAAYNPELLKILFENAQKYNITFSQDSWNLALWNGKNNPEIENLLKKSQPTLIQSIKNRFSEAFH